MKNAIILGAGQGTRMLPYTKNNSKLLFKVKNKPLLYWHISRLKSFGFDNIIITAYHCAEKINYFRKIQGVEIFKEDKLIDSGTACNQVFKKYGIDKALIVYGDTYFDISYYISMAKAYKQNRNYMLVQPLTRQVLDEQVGLVKYNKSDRITEIAESGYFDNVIGRDKLGKNAGMLILNGNVLKNGDLMKNVLPKCKSLYAVFTDNKWCDIGSLESYIKLIFENYENPQVKWLIENEKDKTIEFVKRILSADRILIAGNGGSMSTAQHIALDWSKVGKKNAIALDSSSIITAYGNDEGFENIFIKQLDRYRPTNKDVILLISGSGNSPNIRKVIEMYSNDMILGMSGNKGLLKDNIRLTLPVISDNIRVIEDAHLCYGHCITEIMEGLL